MNKLLILILLFMQPVYAETLYGGVDLNETVGKRVINWNSWVDRFRIAAYKREFKCLQYAPWKDNPVVRGSAVKSIITIYRDGSLYIEEVGYNDPDFAYLTHNIYASLEHTKYTAFPKYTQRDKVVFMSCVAVSSGPGFKKTTNVADEVVSQ